MQKFGKLIVVGAVCLVIGYIAGREHMRSQLLDAMIAMGVAGGFAASDPSAADESDGDPPPAPATP